MHTKFFTNEGENSLLKKIEGVFEHKKIHFFEALVGYFRASGYFRVRPFMEKAQQIRILVGIDIDALVYRAEQQGVLFEGDAQKAQELFFKNTKNDIQEAEYDYQVENGILQLIQDIATQKVQIKIHPKRNIHAKVYIFREEHKHTHGYGVVITGSSNLTEQGLERNVEFNVELREDADVAFALDTFEKLWEEAEALQATYIERLKQETYLNDTYTPYQIYLKFLIEYFGKNIDYDANTITDLPTNFKKLAYQIDAVNDGFSKMMKHNGFFLADVVGLGKTLVSVMIARKFFYSNGFPSYQSNVLIITPPALKQNWQETLEYFEFERHATIVTNGSLHKVANAKKYDLIIIDEAHKFRSDTSGMYNALQKICKTHNRLRETDIIPKKVILVSATPLNNKPEDIANLVYLFQDAKESSLAVGNLQHFFRQQIDEYNKLKKEPIGIIEITQRVSQIYERIRTKVIEPITVRRTRTDLRENEAYRKDIEEQGIAFPAVHKPIKIFYTLAPDVEALYDRTIYLLVNDVEGLAYYRYRAIECLLPPKKAKYITADLISKQLAKMMKTGLVKRLDSSFHAFKQSLQRFLDATQAMVKMFENGKIYIAPNLPVTEYINDEREDELLDLVLQAQITDASIEICEPDDFEDKFLKGLQQDATVLQELVTAWNDVTIDPKLATFVEYINSTLFEKERNPEQKLVVFSESKETARYLAEKLKKRTQHRILVVDSSNRKDLMPTVRENFDANLEHKLQKNDYDIIISTEVLAEGVNLHRANVIINYDTPWNSTRLMQRIGRVNRIGSKAPAVYIYNFFPTAQVNEDIELEKRAIMKLQAFHAALGEDSQVYSPDEQTQTFGMFDKTPDEGRDEKIAYLMQIREFKQNNPDLFAQIKKMPLRARVGRQGQLAKDCTVAFIRDKKRDAFIRVLANGKVEELSFLEIVKSFEAKPEEQGVPLLASHHTHIQKAIAHFALQQEADKARDLKVDYTQGPNEKKATAYLEVFLPLPFLTVQDKQLLRLGITAIQQGRFQNLQRDINKLQNSVKKTPLKPEVLAQKIMKILDSYPLVQQQTPQEPTPDELPQTTKPNKKPQIIISESFA